MGFATLIVFTGLYCCIYWVRKSRTFREECICHSVPGIYVIITAVRVLVLRVRAQLFSKYFVRSKSWSNTSTTYHEERWARRYSLATSRQRLGPGHLLQCTAVYTSVCCSLRTAPPPWCCFCCLQHHVRRSVVCFKWKWQKKECAVSGVSKLRLTSDMISYTIQWVCQKAWSTLSMNDQSTAVVPYSSCSIRTSHVPNMLRGCEGWSYVWRGHVQQRSSTSSRVSHASPRRGDLRNSPWRMFRFSWNNAIKPGTWADPAATWAGPKDLLL